MMEETEEEITPEEGTNEDVNTEEAQAEITTRVTRVNEKIVFVFD